MHIVPGHAPEVLADLPKPNCVFVGGSGGNMRKIIETALMKNPKARIVVNAIALGDFAGNAKPVCRIRSAAGRNHAAFCGEREKHRVLHDDDGEQSGVYPVGKRG